MLATLQSLTRVRRVAGEDDPKVEHPIATFATIVFGRHFEIIFLDDSGRRQMRAGCTPNYKY